VTLPIITVVGARPNFMKMAPVVAELRARNVPQVFVHTGQHYDAKMSSIFFEQLRMPTPDVYLGVGSGSHAEQTAKVLVGFEQLLKERGAARVVVAGDVNSTVACALAASKLGVPVAHVESGLRSRDRGMPEETNRILTDHMSDLLFVTEPAGVTNLAAEGITQGVHLVGNTMIDSVRTHLDNARALQPWKALQLTPKKYGIVTLHRPSNVDDAAVLSSLIDALGEVSQTLPLLFPAHPRTAARAQSALQKWPRIQVCEPLGYLEFLGLMADASVVLTDSGGIQEETTALGVRCITLRKNTERPITVDEGTNELLSPDNDDGSLARRLQQAIAAPAKPARVPALWDGRAAQRVVQSLLV
jgi:UDP-N-acetylglucosamine 2-epimerase (non-hydrolysing)